MSSTPEIGGFWDVGKRGELPPWPMYAQLRAGRRGRDPDRENSLPPFRPP
jgi:hypothetical protein